MNIESRFATPIAFFNLGREYTPEEEAFVAEQPTHRNTGNATSDNTQILDHEVMTNLRKFVQDSVDEYFKTVYIPKFDVSLRFTQSWLNYTQHLEYHHQHSHPNSYVSGVLYIKADKKSDSITFYNPLGYQQILIPSKEFNLWNSETWWFNVGSGDLVLFPSRLIHSVGSVQSKDTRISLSFNTFPVGFVGDPALLTSVELK